MSTQLFLTAAASSLGGTGQKALSTSRGASSTSAITNTVTSGTDIQCTDTAGGNALSWWWQVNAVTISGNITANVRGKESATTANAGAGLVIEHYDSTGTTLLGTILSDRTIPSTITEYTTSDAAKALAAVAPTSTVMAAGDWIKVTLKVRNVGTMSHAAGETVTNTYSGPTSGAAGDTSVTFVDTITAFSPPPPMFDAFGFNSVNSSALTLTLSATVAATADHLIVGVVDGASNDTSTTVSVKAGGVSMTSLGTPVHCAGSDAGFIQLFELHNPPTGSVSIVITVAASPSNSSIIGYWTSWIGVANTANYKTNSLTGGTSGTAMSVTGTSASGDATFCVGAAGAAISAINQDEQAITTVNTSSGAGNGAASIATGATSVAYTGTVSTADFWAMAFIDIVPATTGPPSAAPILLGM